MITSWSLPLLSVVTGTLLITSSTTAEAQQSDGPIITPPKSEIILQSGQNFTLYCRGKSNLQIRQQEVPEEETGDFKKEFTVTSENEVKLALYNVDQYAVGYYACYDNTVDGDYVLGVGNIIEEPNNTAHISYTYIYVNGSELIAPMRSKVIPKGNSKFLIECRPTTPDIIVNLTMDFADLECDTYDPRAGCTLSNDVLSVSLPTIFTCGFERRGNIEYRDVLVHKYTLMGPPQPVISGGSPYFLNGETFSINCSVEREGLPVELSWTIPGPFSKVINVSNEFAVTDVLFNNYTIRNASKEDEGEYICTSKSQRNKTAKFTKIYLENAYINMERKNKPLIEVKSSTALQVAVSIDAYPPVKISYLLDNQTLPESSIKYRTRHQNNMCILTISHMDVTDTGIYTIVASNSYRTENVTYDVRFFAAPEIDFGPETDRRYLIGSIATLRCEVTGCPLPVVDWILTNEDGEQHMFSKDDQEDNALSLYRVVSLLKRPATVSGYIMCKATNQPKGKVESKNATRKFIVYDMPDGFGIKNRDQTWYYQGQDVSFKCLASKYDFQNVSWYREDGDEVETVEYSNNSLSLIATLKLIQVTVFEAGIYTCSGLRKNESYTEETISITVEETRPPEIIDPIDQNIEVETFYGVNLTCRAEAVPPPHIEWYKDDKILLEDKNNGVEISTDYLDHTTINSMVTIKRTDDKHVGKYECRATSQDLIEGKFYSLTLKERLPYKTTYITVIGVIFVVLILLVVYLAWKIRKEKQFRKELALAGLLYFKEGVTKSINPELGIDEQAELLPYDEKFEFPAEKLTLGKQLGAGAFGVVYKAEARGIINAEETTTVAVKMVKKTADNMYIKALASELKIMVHMGKHVNIVNLLGACTKNVGKRELIVIVEYCKFGNIHNYLQKHREVFIDQLTDNPEKNLGKVNRGFSCSSGNSGMQSDYFGSNHTQDTDNTFLNTANTNRSGRKDNPNKQVEFLKVSETGYVQPEWRSNYESDYSFDGRSPRPLCSRDLLAWAFQIARGMEYLASRKVLHGDLAARNILLAEDNIVKICDFGLARSIYKNDEYQKKENSPLPVKWLALECMTDRIFSTQSDVWSFGIVLWELFSLAKTPYPNISPSNLLQWLSAGHRLEKPSYADDRLYDVMKHCWEKAPTARPSFTQLQELLGTFLEDNVRNHYVDLNAVYTDFNINREGEDYLAMVCAPDYKNQVTPSPHHYVNDSRSFFPPTPTQLQHDDEGYLQMSPATRQSIFNARPQGTKFDFESRKLAPNVSELDSLGSELTPMLTLNNLPRSGSESDQEGNASPYLNMCPRIEEETDDVFETKQNNAKNIQPSAVTNPTYITFSTDDEKKPQNFSNINYINVNMPNGLVK